MSRPAEIHHVSLARKLNPTQMQLLHGKKVPCLLYIYFKVFNNNSTMNRNFLSSIYLLPGLLSFFLLSNTRILETISTTVSISDGKIEGIKEVSGVLSFKGIPYALPPIQSLRWKAPQPLDPWTGIKKCTVFAASPMQADPAPFSMWSQEFLIPKEPSDEDCLYLNVWTGARSVNEKRPVLVWIYGGGFSSGGSAVPIYNGESLARKGIVFVNINYRVGIFGFLAHPWLTKESPYNASGNYGMLDQVAALQWVKKNIAHFGGDPENVTIAGQSAGSMSVNCLIASPLAHGLFNKAIAESGASFLRNSPLAPRVSQMDLKQAEQEGTRIAVELKTTTIDELKNIPSDELLKKVRFSARPIIDGYFLPESIPAIFNQHKENKVALLTGWNEDEGLLFGPVKSANDFKKDIERQYGSDAGALLHHYPASSDEEAAGSQLKLSRDLIFGAQNYVLANKINSYQPNVFVYRFTRKVPGTGEYAKYGAFHTGEVPYALDNLQFVNRPWEAADHDLAKTMSTYWVNFIAFGDPNDSGLPDWPRYDLGSKKIMDLGIHPAARTIPDSTSLNFLASRLMAD